MMKKNLVLRIGALALAGCCITMTMLSGTFAKYTSTISGAATATVAKWSFNVNKETSGTLDIKILDTLKTAGLKNGTIAPGTSGSFDLTLDGSGSEVDMDYAITIEPLKSNGSNVAGDKNPLTFTIKEMDATGEPEKFVYADGKLVKEGTIIYAEGEKAMQKIYTIGWEWPDAVTDGEDNNYADLETISLPITITATQVTPTESTASAN